MSFIGSRPVRSPAGRCRQAVRHCAGQADLGEHRDLEVRATGRGPLALRRGVLLARTLVGYWILRSGIPLGGFVPKLYLKQLVENSDFRKYDDALRMVLDCSGDLADQLEGQLAEAAEQGTIRYGMHRQDAAMMTCFTPSATRSDHVHFIDGARGGYASAAAALKASLLR